MIPSDPITAGADAVSPTETRGTLADGIRPYLERAPIAAFFLGISSGFPFAMIGATMTTWLSQAGVDKKTVTTFTLVFLAYNLKWLWAWVVDGVRLPLLGRLGQRVSWMLVTGALVIAATINLGFADPNADLAWVATSAILVGFAGASFDIVIDAYRIEILEPRQLGVGSGMVQYGWRIGSAGAGALALLVAARSGWSTAYLACAALALPAMLTAFIYGEPRRHRPPSERKGIGRTITAMWKPFVEFLSRRGGWLVLLFILLHKIGDTLANLVLRILLNDQGYSNDEIALYDVGIGFWALMIGVFVGGVMYARMGLKRSVMVALILMGVSNLSFAGLAAAGHNAVGLGLTMAFENFASGIGGVVVVAYFSALTDLRFTASQYALISAAASIVGRLLTGTTAGEIVSAIGFVNYYLMTTIVAVPGILLFWLMVRLGLIDSAMGTAGKVGEGDARADAPAAAA